MKLSPKTLLPILSITACAEYVPHAEPKCEEIVLPIEATAQNWDFPAYPNTTDRKTLLKYVSQTLPQSGFSNKPKKTVSGTFKIAARFCEPVNKVPSRENTVQFLLHGFGSSKAYWHGIDYPDATFAGEYSWVHHATSQGYSTLSIDNLGNGDSDHPDPIEVVQFPLQQQILLNIIHGLRAGNLSSCVPKFDKVIMASHSYGALHSRNLAISYPTDAADAYILTATAYNIVGVSSIVQLYTAGSASAYDPERLGDLPPAYMSFDSAGMKDGLYPLDGEYDPELFAFDQSLTHTFTVGELASPKLNTTSNFTGPVMVLTGRLDAIACDAQGNNTAHVADCGVGQDSIPGQTAQVFPNAQFGVYVPDKTGHNLNLGYSAPEVFGSAHTFLEAQGF